MPRPRRAGGAASQISSTDFPVRQSLTALSGGKAATKG